MLTKKEPYLVPHLYLRLCRACKTKHRVCTNRSSIRTLADLYATVNDMSVAAFRAAGHSVIDHECMLGQRIDAHPSSMTGSAQDDALHFCMPGPVDYALDNLLRTAFPLNYAAQAARERAWERVHARADAKGHDRLADEGASRASHPPPPRDASTNVSIDVSIAPALWGQGKSAAEAAVESALATSTAELAAAEPARAAISAPAAAVPAPADSAVSSFVKSADTLPLDHAPAMTPTPGTSLDPWNIRNYGKQLQPHVQPSLQRTPSAAKPDAKPPIKIQLSANPRDARRGVG